MLIYLKVCLSILFITWKLKYFYKKGQCHEIFDHYFFCLKDYGVHINRHKQFHELYRVFILFPKWNNLPCISVVIDYQRSHWLRWHAVCIVNDADLKFVTVSKFSEKEQILKSWNSTGLNTGFKQRRSLVIVPGWDTLWDLS